MKNGYYKDEFGNQEWRKNGKLHREDGPAIIYAHGSQEWWVNGKLHREDGPAYIGADGAQYWYLNDKPHREDGPAVIWSDGTQSWYLNGKNVTDEVNEWFKEYNLTYETMSLDELGILKFNMLLFSKKK